MIICLVVYLILFQVVRLVIVVPLQVNIRVIGLNRLKSLSSENIFEAAEGLALKDAKHGSCQLALFTLF